MGKPGALAGGTKQGVLRRGGSLNSRSRSLILCGGMATRFLYVRQRAPRICVGWSKNRDRGPVCQQPCAGWRAGAERGSSPKVEIVGVQEDQLSPRFGYGQRRNEVILCVS